MPEFKKWYNHAKEYIKRENIKRGKDFINKNYVISENYYLLTIQFCCYCKSYTICYLIDSFSYIKCKQCNNLFCIGCKREFKEGNNQYIGNSTCLKGYLMALYLRIIYRRADLEKTHSLFHLIHIIICLFFTPLYLGFFSNFMGIIVHPNKKREKPSLDVNKLNCYIIYSILRGFLMFPYIILFLPFMIILLLPGIFSYKYYLYIFNMYVATALPGSMTIRNVGDN